MESVIAILYHGNFFVHKLFYMSTIITTPLKEPVVGQANAKITGGGSSQDDGDRNVVLMECAFAVMKVYNLFFYNSLTTLHDSSKREQQNLAKQYYDYVACGVVRYHNLEPVRKGNHSMSKRERP